MNPWIMTDAAVNNDDHEWRVSIDQEFSTWTQLYLWIQKMSALTIVFWPMFDTKLCSWKHLEITFSHGALTCFVSMQDLCLLWVYKLYNIARGFTPRGFDPKHSSCWCCVLCHMSCFPLGMTREIDLLHLGKTYLASCLGPKAAKSSMIWWDNKKCKCSMSAILVSIYSIYI